jgi:1-acyl-sn-glycerol-3-phosphate acyltransferase
MTTPPPLVRRLILAPALVLAELALLAAIGPLTLVALAAAPVVGLRPVRLLAVAATGLARHVAAMAGCLALWLASGFGAFAGTRRGQEAHYALLRRFVGGVWTAIADGARVELAVEESDQARALLDGPRPVLVLARHAGQGDSLLILHELLCRHRRRPRIVMHERLRLDPLTDVLGHRLPNRFVDPRGGDTEVEIAAMARDLGPGDAVLLFPEGGNVSEERRRRAIERLERAGHAEEARWALAMRHVSAPRPGGTLAAMEAAPGADIVFLAHDGVPETRRDIWRALGGGTRVRVRYWVAPRAEVPDDRDGRIDWLFGWWRTIDDWIADPGVS